MQNNSVFSFRIIFHLIVSILSVIVLLILIILQNPPEPNLTMVVFILFLLIGPILETNRVTSLNASRLQRFSAAILMTIGMVMLSSFVVAILFSLFANYFPYPIFPMLMLYSPVAVILGILFSVVLVISRYRNAEISLLKYIWSALVLALLGVTFYILIILPLGILNFLAAGMRTG
jgi:hypothetical protein